MAKRKLVKTERQFIDSQRHPGDDHPGGKLLIEQCLTRRSRLGCHTQLSAVPRLKHPALNAVSDFTPEKVGDRQRQIGPVAQFPNGRDHNNRAFTIWMAGGGVKAGLRHGISDDYRYEGVEGRVHIHDLHATMLRLLGLDHEKLTYRYSGRDFRLTDVHGKVVKQILA